MAQTTAETAFDDRMPKDEWISIAAARIRDHLGDKSEPEKYAQNLYKEFVEDAIDDEWFDDPDGAAREAIADWDPDPIEESN